MTSPHTGGKQQREDHVFLVDTCRREILSPVGWVKCADALLASVAKLEPLARKYWSSEGADREESKGFLKIALMLAGFAMENLLKAIIVKTQRDSLEASFIRKRELPPVLREHDLCRLATLAGRPPHDEQTRRCLDLLARHSVWAGRYPTPVWPEDVPMRGVLGLGKDWVCIESYQLRDWESIIRLLRNARRLADLGTIAPAPRDAPTGPKTTSG